MHSPCLQILNIIYVKYKSQGKKINGLFYNVKFKEQTIHILHDSNKEYSEKCKATFTKQVKEILDIPNPQSTACSIKENIELQIEEICLER